MIAIGIGAVLYTGFLSAPLFADFFAAQTASAEKLVEHVTMPEEVRGVYWTATTAGGAYGHDLLAHMLRSHLNTAVIDLQLQDGSIAFIPENKELLAFANRRPIIKDLDGLLQELADDSIYRIARISVFRNNRYVRVNPTCALKVASGALWHDGTGFAWVDSGCPDLVDHISALAEEAYARGFDEIQLDYVRFPDRNISSIVYPYFSPTEPKYASMKKFFEAIGTRMQEKGIPLSLDIFGITLWAHNDFNIGQRLIDAYPNADYISPMVYPSHFADNFQGYKNPALFPYELVARSLEKGNEILKKQFASSTVTVDAKKMRPWLQDFDIGASYGAPQVEAQIKAARAQGASGWLLWNPSNRYDDLPFLK